MRITKGIILALQHGSMVAGIAVEPFSVVCVTVCCIYIDRTHYYFVVKNISGEKFSWFGPTMKIF